MTDRLKGLGILCVAVVLLFQPAHAQNKKSAKQQTDYSDIETVIDENQTFGAFRNLPRSECGAPSLVNEEPVLVSALLKNYDEQVGSTGRLTEPMTTTGPQGKVTKLGVPAFSILKPLAPINFASSTTSRVLVQVPIRVLSLPNEEALKEMQTNRRLARAVNGLPIAEEGAEGNMRLGAVHRAPEYVFKVKDPSVLSAFPKIEEVLADGSVRFVEKDNSYLARECCVGTGPDAKCAKQFAFEVISDKNPDESRRRYFDNTPNNELFTALFPVRTDNLNSMANILALIEEPEFDFIDFRYFDTRGFVKVPLDHEGKVTTSAGQVVAEMQRGPLNTLHYRSDDPNANDAFGHPTAICAFFQAVKKYNQTCKTPECRVQWGDFYHSDKWYTHNEHHGGTCVDVRPIPKKEDYDGLNYVNVYNRCVKAADGKSKCTSRSVINPNYDRVRTQALVDAFVAAGGVGSATEEGVVKVQKILFNDTRGIQGVTRADGHSNHMHVCFPINRDKVLKTCEDGI